MSWVMIQRYEDLQVNEKDLRRLTGLRREEFASLYRYFKQEWDTYFSNFTFGGTPRLRRRVYVRKNSIFADPQDVLLFALVYLKGSFPQEKLAESFGIDQPKASRYLSLTQRILQNVIEKKHSIISKKKQRELLDIIIAKNK